MKFHVVHKERKRTITQKMQVIIAFSDPRILALHIT